MQRVRDITGKCATSCGGSGKGDGLEEKGSNYSFVTIWLDSLAGFGEHALMPRQIRIDRCHRSLPNQPLGVVGLGGVTP